MVFNPKVRDAASAASGRTGVYAFAGVRQMSSLADQPSPALGRDSSVVVLVEQLYRSHGGLVRSVCRSILRDRVETEDAAQQTFLSAQRALMNGSSPQDAAAWLATIARNESLRRVRARMREPLSVELEGHGVAPDIHATVSQRYEAGELRDAITQLPQQQREAILLREVRGLSAHEVAAVLSLTTHAAESVLYRARHRLRTQLQSAFAGLSPGLWVPPLRELATRAASGGLAAPAAAKVAAVSVGTALVAGGAIAGPTVIHRLAHAPRHVPSTSRLANRASNAEASAAPLTFSRSQPRRPVRAATIHQQQRSRATSKPASPQNSSEQGAPSSNDNNSQTGSSDVNSRQQDTSSSNDNSQTGSTDVNAQQQDTSSPNDNSQTGSTDSNSTDSSTAGTGGDSTPGD